ncbi:uncharacterized protein LOC114525621 isoform X2 [Dendronephthya gigantea]|uniref:uncharacterized protein LOC114525621 isoform X2 n=1 Tax=Dendronephthya gigantea TaxID=151771 RepID=UPI00106BD925|nr:uncharacterized protein LOC114525621 isoform X2 [Dendronephthya gigantea]
MAHSSRAKPYVVEIQRHYYSDDLSRRERKGHPIGPQVSPNVYPFVPSTRKSFDKRTPGRAPMSSSRFNRGSLEYEDIYNQRHASGNSHLKHHGRWSFRDDGEHGRVRGYTRRPSKRIAHPTELKQMNGDVEHSRINNNLRDISDSRDQNRTVGDKDIPMRANYTMGQSTESRKGPKGSAWEQKKVKKDSKENQRQDLELWIVRQTSFPKKQDGVENTSGQKAFRSSNVSHSKLIPPLVAAKPSRPQTSRSASPASSVRSNQSVASSHVSHHSARSGTSEVSVKSILKKPKPAGRVVLKEEPSSYRLCAILSCILCFPFGIYALAKSRQVNDAVGESDYEAALSSSKKVKNFSIGVLLAYIGWAD